MESGHAAAALEQAILADPDADEPRRHLAALLEAQQDPRGRLIQLQLEIVAFRRRGASPPLAMRTEADQLITQHGASWAGRLAHEVAAHEFRRGFVEHVTLVARAFLTKAERMFALAPIRHLTLTDVKPVAAMLFASPHLGRMRSLSLSGDRLGDDGVAALARSPHVGGLRWLNLDGNAITRVGLDALASSNTLTSLRFVSFRGNSAGDPTPFPQLPDGWSDWSDPGFTELGRELIARHGPVAWLAQSPPGWPMDRDYDPA